MHTVIINSADSCFIVPMVFQKLRFVLSDTAHARHAVFRVHVFAEIYDGR